MSIKEKLTAELTDAKLGKYETAVKNAVMKTICKFCEQNAEFKQAIEQSGKSFADCLKATVKGVGASLEDLEVYKRAVAFYFPGADIKCTMTLDLGDGGFSSKTPQKLTAASYSLILTACSTSEVWYDKKRSRKLYRQFSAA